MEQRENPYDLLRTTGGLVSCIHAFIAYCLENPFDHELDIGAL